MHKIKQAFHSSKKPNSSGGANDASASSTQEANSIAVNSTVSALNSISSIPAVHRQWILSDYPSLGAVKNMYKHQPNFASGWTGVVVEVSTRFEGVKGNGEKYVVTCLLDIDIPPDDSTQQPHFGWEVELDGRRVGNGHVWLPAGLLKAGRPKPGWGLEKYGFEGIEEKEFDGDGKVSRVCHFRRYK